MSDVEAHSHCGLEIKQGFGLDVAGCCQRALRIGEFCLHSAHRGFEALARCIKRLGGFHQFRARIHARLGRLDGFRREQRAIVGVFDPQDHFRLNAASVGSDGALPLRSGFHRVFQPSTRVDRNHEREVLVGEALRGNAQVVLRHDVSGCVEDIIRVAKGEVGVCRYLRACLTARYSCLCDGGPNVCLRGAHHQVLPKTGLHRLCYREWPLDFRSLRAQCLCFTAKRKGETECQGHHYPHFRLVDRSYHLRFPADGRTLSS